MMKRILIVLCFISLQQVKAQTVFVRNNAELQEANMKAKPGEIIILKNGNWKDVILKLDATGTKEKPITYKAETAGEVKITGNSNLLIGGTWLVVDGLSFTEGYTYASAVIQFKTDSKHLANYCRVTNTVIDDFNPKRMEENYWIGFYGKHNRVDHCSFINKKNMGVLIAIMLDTEESRENFHSIDHNYFGERPPLASNTGELIRVGVSTYCEFNSNTQITDNYFYHCDGETEIISLKSGANLVKNNLFTECQGSVVFRHGDDNVVTNNIFLGNNKPGTGGIRIINKGQWVVNNFFYQCRGIDFRSPLSIMNGVPNSPKNRYVPVTDAVVANNSFVECTPISFAEGSDDERSVAPNNVLFANNLFYNTRDSLIYNSFDDISGIRFANNIVSKQYEQNPAQGWTKAGLSTIKISKLLLPVPNITKYTYSDSIRKIALAKGISSLSSTAGFSSSQKILTAKSTIEKTSGAVWYAKKRAIKYAVEKVICANEKEVYAAISGSSNSPVSISLIGTEYNFTEPLIIKKKISLSANKMMKISIGISEKGNDFLFMIAGNGILELNNINADLSNLNVKHFISGDTSGSSNHSNLKITNCNFENNKGSFYFAPKESVSDSIIVRNTAIKNWKGTIFSFKEEDDKKGYYNVEKLIIEQCNLENIKGQLLTMLRTGNDESTMGPNLLFTNNKILNCKSEDNKPFIHLYGTQVSNITNNKFAQCCANGVLIKYEDIVRAHHLLDGNMYTNSGMIERNEFVTDGSETMELK